MVEPSSSSAPSAPSRSEILRIHNNMQSQLEEMQSQIPSLISASSSSSFSSLNQYLESYLSTHRRISLSELQLNQQNDNTYMRGHLIVDPILIRSVATVFEESNEENNDRPVVRVAISNAVSTQAEAEKVFPMGSNIIILNPKLQLGAMDNWPIIRVTDCSSLILLDIKPGILLKAKEADSEEDDEEEEETEMQRALKEMESQSNNKRKENKLSAKELKENGNAKFRQREYAGALQLYQQAIDSFKPDEDEPDLLPTLYTNSAACYLELSQPQEAEKSILKIIASSSSSSSSSLSAKQRYRLAQALLLQGKAGELLHRFQSEDREEEILKLVQNASKLLSDSIAASSDSLWNTLFSLRQQKNTNAALEIANNEKFCPRVCVGNVTSSSSPPSAASSSSSSPSASFVALKVISAGEMIILERPVAFAFDVEAQGGGGGGVEATYRLLFERLGEKVLKEPKISGHLRSMFPSCKLASTSYDIPQWLLESDDLQNDKSGQGKRLFSLLQRLRKAGSSDTLNFREIAHLAIQFSSPMEAEEQAEAGLGLYPILSTGLPHSCHPNACVVYAGDVAVVKALKSIAEGEKITVSYLRLDRWPSDRISLLSRGFGISTCECDRCSGKSEDDRVALSLGCVECGTGRMLPPRGLSAAEASTRRLHCEKCEASISEQEAESIRARVRMVVDEARGLVRAAKLERAAEQTQELMDTLGSRLGSGMAAYELLSAWLMARPSSGADPNTCLIAKRKFYIALEICFPYAHPHAILATLDACMRSSSREVAESRLKLAAEMDKVSFGGSFGKHHYELIQHLKSVWGADFASGLGLE